MNFILIAAIITVVTQISLQQRYYYSRLGWPTYTYRDYDWRLPYCRPYVNWYHVQRGYVEPRGILSWAGKVLGNVAERAGKTISDVGKSAGDTMAVVGKDADRSIGNVLRGGLNTIEKGAKGVFNTLHGGARDMLK